MTGQNAAKSDSKSGNEAQKGEDCLFCKIIDGEIPSKKVYEDESVYAFDDIAPQAAVHVLIIPKVMSKMSLRWLAKTRIRCLT